MQLSLKDTLNYEDPTAPTFKDSYDVLSPIYPLSFVATDTGNGGGANLETSALDATLRVKDENEGPTCSSPLGTRRRTAVVGRRRLH